LINHVRAEPERKKIVRAVARTSIFKKKKMKKKKKNKKTTKKNKKKKKKRTYKRAFWVWFLPLHFQI